MVRPSVHALPHRGSPSASHARVRWQPYNTSLTRSSPLAYLVTPASSPRLLAHPNHVRHHPSRETKLREIQKSKFVLTLVDQAVKSLCDIWPHQDIPPVFLTSPSVPDHSHAANILHFASRNTQLPSPISPTTQPTPVVSPVSSYSVHPIQLPQCDIAPMKSFVHEVLRRSRTSGTVLQTALCYLEAIRSKIPDLARKEKQAFSSSSPVGSDNDRISQGEVGLDSDSDLPTPALSTSYNVLATVRINPIPYEADTSFSIEPAFDAHKLSAHKSKTNTTLLSPLPPLPSPLLCPRRAFLASLILASKFVQDRCYSNRAWAKLSGLPPREIGRCERALGEALEWRLWVGKLPAAQSTPGRALVKTKSESDIPLSANPLIAHLACDVDPRSGSSMVSPPGSKITPLRRCSTMPSGSLGPPINRTGSISPSAYSSSPSTPGLSYSPTPTESSLGDRTVQMTSFMDISTPPPGQFASLIGAQNDKVLGPLSVPSSGLYMFASSQDAVVSSLPQQIDSHYFLPHGAIPPNSMWSLDCDA